MITPKLQIKGQMATAPYDHQQRVYLQTRDLPEYGLFWEMGTGKSKTLIDTACHLFGAGEIDGVLIISDKGAYLNWHYEEIIKHIWEDVPFRRAFWSSSLNRRDKYWMEQLMIAKDDMLDFLCVNVESLNFSAKQRIVSRGHAVAEKFLHNHYAMIIVDESTSIKSLKAGRTKSCLRLRGLADYRRIATGTPITQDPLDLFAQCEFLRERALGHKSFVTFRSHYAQMISITLGTRSFPKIVGFQNLEDLTLKLQAFTSRILKTECLDLPEKVYETHFVEQTIEQRRAYDELKNVSLIQFEQGLLTSTSALTALNKLHQINCGHVKIDDGTVIDLPSNRVSALLDLLEVLDDKCVVWCAYQRDVQLIIAALEALEGNHYPTHYYGQTSDEDRRQALRDFLEDPRCRWFVGTAATGGKGITLVEARYAVYYSNTYMLEDRLQSEDRIHRIGQARSCTYFDLACPKTIDVKIIRALKSKRDLASDVLDNFRNLLVPA